MYRSLVYLLTGILVSSVALAEERSFIFLETHRDKYYSLSAACHGSGAPTSHKEMVQFAKELGFQTGSCLGPFTELAVSFFTLGMGPLYLTPTQLEGLVQAAEAHGNIRPYQVSQTWPPKD